MIILLTIIAFIIGSIPTGLIIAKSKGIDLRKVGSGNIGATNVMRAMGKKAALFTLLGDVAKGAVPILIYRGIEDWGLGTSNHLIIIEGLMGLSAIVGHNFSIFLRFKGGKGVATSLGVLLVYSPYVAFFTIMLWLLTAKLTKYSSLGALVAFGLLPLSIYMLDYSEEKLVITSAITILIFLRHTQNIKRLIKGTESRIGETVNG